jgi:hypothetical protein
MADNFTTTLYLAVGYLSQLELEQRDRENLLGPRAAAPPVSVQIVSVGTTVYHYNTGSQDLGFGAEIYKVGRGAGSFVVVPMSKGFEGDQTSFNDYMQKEGQSIFGKTAPVHLISVDLTLQPPA